MSSENEKIEWVEIIEPRTKERMYANLTTGECVWDPPEGVNIKRTDESQWWELFDINTQRFYYYNVAHQTTVWHRPSNCDIIPLAKLQTLKQNTSPSHSVILSERHSSRKDGNDGNFIEKGHSSRKCLRIPVPTNSKAESHRHCGYSNHRSSCSQKTHGNPLMDANRTSDSSLSSSKYGSRNGSHNRCFDCTPNNPILSESNSSQNLPYGGPFGSGSHKSDKKQMGGILPQSNSLELCKVSPSHRERVMSNASRNSKSRRDVEKCSPDMGRHDKNAIGKIQSPMSLTRSGSFMSPPHAHNAHMVRKQSIDGGANSDDSMHEKYFRSVENTPISRRRNISPKSAFAVQKKHGYNSSDLRGNEHELKRPNVLKGLTSFDSASNSGALSSSHSKEPSTSIEPDKLRIVDGVSSMRMKTSYSPNGPKSGISSLKKSVSSASSSKSAKVVEEIKYPTNKSIDDGKRHKKNRHGLRRNIEHDNGNTSPMYSNWDQEHLLPLQHYIMEQAKLSGYRFDQLDSDSLHSDDSIREDHSYSGDESDQDSDYSDSRGDYLTHIYGAMADYANAGQSIDGEGMSYYNIGDLRLDNFKERVYDNRKNFPKHRPEFSSSERANTASTKVVSDTSPFSTEGAKGGHKPKIPVNESKKLDPKIEEKIISKPQLVLMNECDIEKFAQDNLNLHSKGLFRKKASIRDMLSWTSHSINRPMLAISQDKNDKKCAIELFKLVQIYMGDRKARAGMTLNSVAIDIMTMTLNQQHLRDEMYVQLCRQTTENPTRESLIRGWELLAVCLSFIPPSPTFQPALLNYMNRHRDPTFETSFPDIGKWPIHVQISHYATVSCRRLSRIGCNGRRKVKKPTEEEVNQARMQIFRDSMFGNTIEEVMDLQKERYPNQKIPWILLILTRQILALNGRETEGIFRISADMDEVNFLKSRLDHWDIPNEINNMDAHAPASLLKLWFRELYDPIIPDDLYDDSVKTEDPEKCAQIIERLPALNKLVLTFLIHFLQQFAVPDVVANTKMDSSNLAMVFAPNCLRCTSEDTKVILENARKEMSFVRTLIQTMDTSMMAEYD